MNTMHMKCLHLFILGGLSMLILMHPMRTEAQGEGPRVYLMTPVGLNAFSATYDGYGVEHELCREHSHPRGGRQQ